MGPVKLIAFVGNRFNALCLHIEEKILYDTLSVVTGDRPFRSVYVSGHQYVTSDFTLSTRPIFDTSQDYRDLPNLSEDLKPDVVGIDCTTHGASELPATLARFLNSETKRPLLVVLHVHFPIKLPSSITRSIAYIVFTRDNVPSNRKRTYENYLRDLFPTFEEFCDFMDDKTLEGDGFFILHNATRQIQCSL